MQACAVAPHDCGVAGTVLPSLLLIGTRKAGTTALSNLLREHPQIIMPNCTKPIIGDGISGSSGSSSRDSSSSDSGPWPRNVCVWDKEVRYYSRALRQGTSLCWYRSRYRCPARRFERSAVEAVDALPSSDGFTAFDGSPDYLVVDDVTVALMSSQLGPRARLVALLRNPSDRFYSAYNMGFNEELIKQANSARVGGRADVDPGRVTYEGFARSLDRMLHCAPGCPDEPHVVSMFFEYGLYAKHLRKFARHFGWERLLIERSEDFYEDSASAVVRVLRFASLGVPDDLVATLRRRSLSKEKRNAGKLWGGASYAGRLQPAERQKLQAWYEPHNRELYALIGRDMGWERSDGAVGGETRAIARHDQLPTTPTITPTVEDAHVQTPLGTSPPPPFLLRPEL
jgi:hypothetical protein